MKHVAVEAEISVESQCFRLYDPASTDDVVTAVGGLTDDIWVAVNGSAAAFLSAANGHTATVRAEAWLAEPPEADGSESVSPIAALTSPSGTLVVDSLTGSTGARDLPLPGPGTYALRAFCRGRAAAAEVAERRFDLLGTDDEVDVHFRDVEHWLLQLWPL